MENLMVHVRFSNDGSVREMGNRPEEMSTQDWFNYLSRHTTNCYESLSGGRGVFRLDREQLATLQKVG